MEKEPLDCKLCFSSSHTSHESYVDHVVYCVTCQFPTSQNIKHSTSFLCILCNKNYSSLLDLVMHTKECAAKMAVTMGYPGPVASIPQSMVENITDKFEFGTEHFQVTKIDAQRRRGITERFISNSAYFSPKEVTVGVMTVPWDFLYDRSFKKEREMKLSEQIQDYLDRRKLVVSRGSDWTRRYHIKHRFIENDYPNFSPQEIEKVEICDKELHSDIISVATVKIKVLILRYV